MSLRFVIETLKELRPGMLVAVLVEDASKGNEAQEVFGVFWFYKNGRVAVMCPGGRGPMIPLDDIRLLAKTTLEAVRQRID